MDNMARIPLWLVVVMDKYVRETGPWSMRDCEGVRKSELRKGADAVYFFTRPVSMEAVVACFEKGELVLELPGCIGVELSKRLEKELAANLEKEEGTE